MHRRQLLILSLLSATATACHSLPGTAGSTSGAPSESYQALDAATQHYAALLRGAPPDSVAAAFVADGELVLPGRAPLRGRKAIAAYLTPLSTTVHVVSVEMQTDSERVAGTSAQQAGHYVQVAGPRRGPTETSRGRYDALWRRGPEGQWRFVRLTMRPAR